MSLSTSEGKNSGSSGGHGDVTMAFSEIGGVLVALPIGDVVGIIGVDTNFDRVTQARAVDVAIALALDDVLSEEERRGIELQLEGEPWLVLLGRQIRIKRVAAAEIQPLPAYVGGVSKTTGIVGLVRVAENHAYVLSASRLVNLVR